MSLLRWTFLWLYAATWVPWLCCAVIYGRRRPWRNPNPVDRRVGVAMFVLYCSMTAVLLLAVLTRLVVLPLPLLIVLAVFTLAAVCAAGVFQLVSLLRVQRDARRLDQR